MADVLALQGGGYRYIKGVFQYSAGVAAADGYRLERARFSSIPELEEGFAAIRSHLRSLDRPMSALCACELRSPRPFSESEFKEFNRRYVAALGDFGVLSDDCNPVARTNVCLEIDPPPVASVYAFSYTVPHGGSAPSRDFVVSGSGEVPEGMSSYRDHVIRLGDRSPEGLRTKARWVCAEMERRMKFLGFGWENSTGTQVYTVHDIHPFLADELVRRGASKWGLSWHFSRPPVTELDYEMDVRAVSQEIVL